MNITLNPEKEWLRNEYRLSRREQFAMTAMNSLIMLDYDPEQAAVHSLQYADALIYELDKETK